MNQRGDVYSGIMIFIGILVIAGLYITTLETPIKNAIANSPVNGQGSDTYLIILSISIFIVLFAVYRLVKSPENLSFGGG